MCIITFFIIRKLSFIFRAAVRFINWWLNSHLCVGASHFQLMICRLFWLFNDRLVYKTENWSLWNVLVTVFPENVFKLILLSDKTVQNPKSLAKAANPDIWEPARNQTVALMVQFNVWQRLSVPATPSAFSISRKFSKVNQRFAPCILDFLFCTCGPDVVTAGEPRVEEEDPCWL